MYIKSKFADVPDYPTAEFECETVEDLDTIVGMNFGDKALVYSTGEIYVYRSDKTWKKLGGGQ